MSMICYKGKVLTVDSNDTVAGFLVEDKGRIVYVGNELPEQYKNVQTVELGKKVLVPAFVDTHQHMASFSTFHAGLNVMDAESNEEIAQMFDKTFEEDLTFSSENSDFVIVKDIDFFSLCEHHMLPFFGKAHVAYIPKKYITGLSKIPRVVDIFARRLQIQERLTMQIKDCIQETLDPLGVMVVIEAQHMCMQMRGVEKQNSLTTTSDFTGFFQQAKTREEFMNLIKNNR